MVAPEGCSCSQGIRVQVAAGKLASAPYKGFGGVQSVFTEVSNSLNIFHLCFKNKNILSNYFPLLISDNGRGISLSVS